MSNTKKVIKPSVHFDFSAHESVDKSHYSDVIMGAMAFQITNLTIVNSTVYLGEDQRKHHSSASLALVRGNSLVTGEFPAQRASNAGNVSIWWRHRGHWKLSKSIKSIPYIRQRSGSSLDQGMSWRLLGAKPLPEPKMTDDSLSNGPLRINFGEIWIKLKTFSWKEFQKVV